MSNGINFNDLTYNFTNPNFAPIKFMGFRGPLDIYNKIKNGNISMKEEEECRGRLNEI